ncbi:hypothetical protein [Pseudophaeobacter leonis]|uniref:hypothetical protein n=1 Tax=Pseudophaeobacter leonis TaxID=1144477 RepID=UPI0009F2F5D7|nr:hypothetical protein [Pseudophaeobacter leonis]
MRLSFVQPLQPKGAVDAMNVYVLDTKPTKAARHVDVLTDDHAGEVFGYRLSGAHSGPNLVVAGQKDVIEGLYGRLAALPTLPWMRGTISLINLEALEDDLGIAHIGHAPNDVIDRILFLLPVAQGTKLKEVIHHGYWSALKLCASLGMVQGRGLTAP